MLAQLNDSVPFGAIQFDGLPYARLSDKSGAAWLEALSKLTFPKKGDLIGWKRFQKGAHQAARRFLGAEICQMLIKLANGDIDALVIDDLPIGKLGSIPKNGHRPSDKSAVSEAVLVGLVMTALCRIFGYKQEKEGDRIHQVSPEPGKENTQSNAGTVQFGFHTDDAFLPVQFRPEFLALFGLTNEKDVPTVMLKLEDILRKLPTDLLEKSRQPIFRFPASQSFVLNGYTIISKPQAVIYEAEGKQRIALPISPYGQDHPEAEAVLRDFREFLDALDRRTIVIKPGRFLAFNNSRVLHGRGPVVGNRWLQRVYFSRSLAAFQKATHSDRQADVFDAWSLLGK